MKNRKQAKKTGSKKAIKRIAKKRKQSIAQLVMGIIAEKKIIADGNRKRFYNEIREAVLKLNPKSKFKDTHFHWYLSRFARQQRLNMGTECLHRIEIGQETKKPETKKAKAKKVSKKKNLKKAKKIKIKK